MAATQANAIRLVAIGDIRPSTYNPRKADPRRLDLVETSLRKLGWLLPVYCDANGEILSGHQRHFVAERMGCQRIPVAYTKAMPLEKRKGINIAFNRGTNDMAQNETPADLTEALERLNLPSLLAAVPEKSIDGSEFFPCMRASMQPIRPYLQRNRGRWINHARMISRGLGNVGVVMPIVARADHWVVNGVGRLEHLAESGAKAVTVVTVSESEAALAEAMLNLLSMDFDIHARYADELRYNSFRRSRNDMKQLGIAQQVMIRDAGAGYNLQTPLQQAEWKAAYGRTVLDFGAGLLNDTRLLCGVGVDCVPFEPYRTVGDRIDREESVRLTRAFLARIAEGVEFDSIFLNSVLNSVPFEQDRRHIVTLIAALASPQTKVYACSVSVRASRAQVVAGATFRSRQMANIATFNLGYERNVSIGDLTFAPKVQKFFTEQEWHDLWADGFEAVATRYCKADLVLAVASQPRVAPSSVRQAVEFEFDLPYPDGQPMGLVEEALNAFRARGAALNSPWMNDF